MKYFYPNQNLQAKIAADLIGELKHNGGILGVCGNGGSAAQAHHLVGELVPYGLPAIAFNDISVLTAISNDSDPIHIFSTQILTFSQQLNKVILLTTSGNSPNIQAAAMACLEAEIDFVLIMGDYNSSKIKDTIASYNFNFDDTESSHLISFKGTTPRVQEASLKFIHHIYEQHQTTLQT